MPSIFIVGNILGYFVPDHPLLVSLRPGHPHHSCSTSTTNLLWWHVRSTCFLVFYCLSVSLSLSPSFFFPPFFLSWLTSLYPSTHFILFLFIIIISYKPLANTIPFNPIFDILFISYDYFYSLLLCH